MAFTVKQIAQATEIVLEYGKKDPKTLSKKELAVYVAARILLEKLQEEGYESSS